MSEGFNNIDNVVRNQPIVVESPPQAAPAKPEPTQPPTTSDRTLLTWTGKSFDYQEKGVLWFAAMGLVVAAISGYLIWQNDWFTLVITLIVSAVMAWYVITARPADQEYSISTFGITISGHYYPFAEIHSFWLVFNQKIQKLYFVQTKKYMPTVTMDISGISPEQVRTILARKIPEQPNRGENTLDQLIRMLKI